MRSLGAWQHSTYCPSSPPVARRCLPEACAAGMCPGLHRIECMQLAAKAEHLPNPPEDQVLPAVLCLVLHVVVAELVLLRHARLNQREDGVARLRLLEGDGDGRVHPVRPVGEPPLLHDFLARYQLHVLAWHRWRGCGMGLSGLCSVASSSHAATSSLATRTLAHAALSPSQAGTASQSYCREWTATLTLHAAVEHREAPALLRLGLRATLRERHDAVRVGVALEDVTRPAQEPLRQLDGVRALLLLQLRQRGSTPTTLVFERKAGSVRAALLSSAPSPSQVRHAGYFHSSVQRAYLVRLQNLGCSLRRRRYLGCLSLLGCRCRPIATRTTRVQLLPPHVDLV